MLSRRVFFGLPITLPFLSLPVKAARTGGDDPRLNGLDSLITHAKRLRSHPNGAANEGFGTLRTRGLATLMRPESDVIQQEIDDRYPLPKR